MLNWLSSIVLGAGKDFWEGRNRLVALKRCIDDLILDFLSEKLTDVGNSFFDELLEELSEAGQYCILHIIIPRLNPDAVIGGGSLEVLRQVVDNDSALEVATKIVQILPISKK